MCKITDAINIFRVALVVWPAQEPRPTPESISQIEFCDASRGKIVKFGERSKSDGMVCGIAIITTPKTSSGEKAYFARDIAEMSCKVCSSFQTCVRCAWTRWGMRW